jgi:hypothetical protein
MTSSSLTTLVAAGFVRAGIWRGGEDIHHFVPAQPGVYVFVVQGKIMYVGSSKGTVEKTTLRSRMRSYQRSQSNGLSKRPVHLAIAELHKVKGKIEVFTLVPDMSEQQIKWKGLPIDLVTGLEAGLIRKFIPKWNIRGRPTVSETVSKRSFE